MRRLTNGARARTARRRRTLLCFPGECLPPTDIASSIGLSPSSGCRGMVDLLPLLSRVRPNRGCLKGLTASSLQIREACVPVLTLRPNSVPGGREKEGLSPRRVTALSSSTTLASTEAEVSLGSQGRATDRARRKVNDDCAVPSARGGSGDGVRLGSDGIDARRLNGVAEEGHRPRDGVLGQSRRPEPRYRVQPQGIVRSYELPRETSPT